MLKFLLATSILDRFCASLCECVLGSDAGSDGPSCDVQACIEWLESNNLFVIPLDNERQWYRYHHLFQELLQRRLLAGVGSAQVTELHRRAAAWFARQGLIDEALRHALTIHDLDLAAQLMVAGLCDVLNREDRATLDRWLRLLPDEFIQRHPWLLMIKTVVVSISWQLAASWKLLGQVEALLVERPLQGQEGDEQVPRPGEVALRSGDSHDLAVLRGMVATLRSQEAYIRGQADRAIAYSEEALAQLPNRWSYIRGVAIQYWGLSMQATGRAEAAQRTLIGEYESLLGKADAYSLRLLFAACFNAIESADLEQARWLAQAMLDHATSGRLPQAVGFARYFLGVVHYYWNELDAARQHFEELVAKRLSVHTQAARNGMIGLARVHVARAEISPVWPVLELLSQFDLDRLGHEGDDARSLRAQLAYLQGDAETAYRWAEAYTAPVVGRSLLWLQDPHMAKARILLARGTDADVRSALDMLDVLYETAQRTFGIRRQIEILGLRALALEMQGKDADALAALQQAVELARPGGFIRTFVDLGPPMQTMLLGLARQDFAMQGSVAETLRRILTAFPEPRKKIATDDAGSGIHAANAKLLVPLLEHLTDRELNILALLRDRWSNKEIAHMLGLSPATVKRYTVNLYGKLSVGKRRDAVIKAEALGILPPR
jgi:LuxR family maltose regulon positive regulatory protein